MRTTGEGAHASPHTAAPALVPWPAIVPRLRKTGQQSEATPMGASAKFATGGKPRGKKDLGLHGQIVPNANPLAFSSGIRRSTVSMAYRRSAREST
jgi:hypothetical protein